MNRLAAANRAKTHCPQGHEYNAENTIISWQGWRTCRICKRKSYSNPKRRPRLSIFERALRKIDFTGPCWEWTGNRHKPGYGYISEGIDGKMVRRMAHRVVYKGLVGPIPDDLTLDHLCRNTSCVNPDHLEPVPIAVNLARGYSPSALNRRKSTCIRGHPLSGDNLFITRTGGRVCRTCQRTLERARKRKGARNEEPSP